MKRALVFSILGAAVGTLLFGGTYALATNTNFILGSVTANKPDALTAVTAQNKDGHGGLNGPMIRLVNASTGGSATPLALNVGSGRPPFVTNSSAKVANLNADLLDGTDSTGFVKGPGQVLSAKLQIVPGDTNTLFDHTATAPKFALFGSCNGDPDFGGAASLTALPAADVLMARPSGVTSYPATTGIGTSVSPNGFVTFNSGWYDGHVVTIWVFLLSKSGQPDPRDDGCYVQAKAVVK